MKLKQLAPWNWFKSEEPDTKAKYELATLHGDGFEPIARLHREMERLFDDFLTSNWPASPSRIGALAERPGFLKPMVDISESDKGYTIKLEVPGVDKEGVKVDIQEDALVIHGEKRLEEEEKNDRFHRRECSYGSFQRVLNLPPDAKSDEIKAKFRDGVLALTIPKTGEKREAGRIIEID